MAEDLRRMTRLHELGAQLVGPGDVMAMLEHVIRAAVDITVADMGTLQTKRPMTSGFPHGAYRRLDQCCGATLPSLHGPASGTPQHCKPVSQESRLHLHEDLAAIGEALIETVSLSRGANRQAEVRSSSSILAGTKG